MRLLEVATSPGATVDRESGTIRGVKVIGTTSRNRRRYPTETLRTAIPLYEGVVVNYNHIREEGVERPMEDRAGWIENVKVDESGGLSGDLRLLTSDARSAKVFEAAEKRPSLIGLSQHAHGQWHVEDGVSVVTIIERVKSVDLVTDAASVSSLFESLEHSEERDCMKTTVREVAEKFKGKDPLADVLSRLLEQDGMAAAGDATVTMPADGSSDGAIKTAFEGAIVAAFRDDKLDTKATLAKIKDILKAYEKLSGPADVKGDPNAAELAPTTESLSLALAGFTASLKEHTALLETIRDRQVTKPRSTPLRESGGGDEKFVAPKDAKEFAKRLCR